jgi:hypothetical protein
MLSSIRLGVRSKRRIAACIRRKGILNGRHGKPKNSEISSKFVLIPTSIGPNMRPRPQRQRPPAAIMNGLAKIIFSGGERLMPARNGYDRELVFDEAEFCARRHGQARLELDRNAMLISIASDTPALCARCGKSADRLTFALGDHKLCRRCARQSTR